MLPDLIQKAPAAARPRGLSRCSHQLATPRIPAACPPTLPPATPASRKNSSVANRDSSAGKVAHCRARTEVAPAALLSAAHPGGRLQDKPVIAGQHGIAARRRGSLTAVEAPAGRKCRRRLRHVHGRGLGRAKIPENTPDFAVATIGDVPLALATSKTSQVACNCAQVELPGLVASPGVIKCKGLRRAVVADHGVGMVSVEPVGQAVIAAARRVGADRHRHAAGHGIDQGLLVAQRVAAGAMAKHLGKTSAGSPP